MKKYYRLTSLIITLIMMLCGINFERINVSAAESMVVVGKPYVNSISKSSMSIGGNYQASITVAGLARRGDTVCIELNGQTAESYVTEDNAFSFSITTRSADITVYLYARDKKQNISEKVSVRLTSQGDYISNNGTQPASNFDPEIIASDINIRIGEVFKPLSGVKAADREDGDLTSKIIVLENNVDTTKTGQYTVIYQVADSDENVIRKEIKVTVYNEKPSIIASDKEVIQGLDFNNLEGVSASDYEDGDLSSKIQVEGTVDTGKVGQYTVTYKVTDSYSNITSKSIKVNVIKSDWANHWGASYIKNAMNVGMVDTSAVFRPEDPINRAEFIKIVNRAFGFTEKGDITYSDVKTGYWYYDEVRIAAKAGYISLANKTFRPNDPITREEVAVILTNLKNNKDNNLDKLNTYKDGYKVSGWAKPSVEGAIESGYMGKGSLDFRPQDKMVRAEAVTALSRIK